MVSCFPFGYQYLRDDDSGQIRVRKLPLLEWMNVLKPRRSKSADPCRRSSQDQQDQRNEIEKLTIAKLSTTGVRYQVKYVGCIEVKKSMKDFDFKTRSELARECIYRVCEAVGIKTSTKRKKINKQLNYLLAKTPNVKYGGRNTVITITSSFLNLTVAESGEVIASHEMPNISFASGGDSETVDFVAYVAKDHCNIRACYILQCGEGVAQNVITSMGQAFELRFQQFLKKAPRAFSVPDKLENLVLRSSAWQEDPDYYNDLPGKVPPDINPSSVQSQNHQSNGTHTDGRRIVRHLTEYPLKESRTDSLSSSSFLPNLFLNKSDSEIDSSCIPLPVPYCKYSAVTYNLRRNLLREEWFHGIIDRQQSEQLVIENGDFLVRESQATPGQYVLTSRQNGICRHLLLVDPCGIVQTKDKTFESISHLVNYHSGNKLPIISADSSIVLNNFIPRRRPSY